MPITSRRPEECTAKATISALEWTWPRSLTLRCLASSQRSISYIEDSAPPETSIDSGPAGPTDDPTPTFGFSSEAGATFECRIDAGEFSTCASPHTTAPLADGPHGFEVRATDALGNADPTPASRSFTVDTEADTQIDSGPEGLTDDPTPTFAFSSNEAAGFECRLDGGGYSACTSPHTTVSLPDGPHTFEVRATDEATNTDPSPASRSFTVDTATSAPPPSRPPDSAAPAAVASPPDTVPPTAKLFGKRRQEAGKPIEIEVSCAEDCVVLATGRVLVWGGPRRPAAGHAAGRRKSRFRLTKVTRQLSAGQGATLKLAPRSRKARRRLRRAVRRGRKARAAIRVKYWDRVGNLSTERLTIRLRRR
jgi:hypothetical protein